MHPPPRQRDSLLALILVAALLARLAAILVLNRLGFSEPVNEHWQIASSLHSGRGFAFDWYRLFPEPQVGSFLPPLYPGFLWFLLLLAGGSVRAAFLFSQLASALAGAATAWLVGALAQRGAQSMRRRRGGPPEPHAGTGEERTSTDEVRGQTAPRTIRPHIRAQEILRSPLHLGAALWAVYPPALGHAAQAQSTAIETFLMALLAWCALRSIDRPTSWARGAITGLILGLVLLARPTAGLIWLLWAAAFLLPAAARRIHLRGLLAATAVAGLVLLPWTVRNLRVHDRLVPVATNGGFNFYMGNNPIWTGGIPPLIKYFPRMEEAERATWRSLSETERDRRFYRMGLAYWAEQPGRALHGVFHRFVSFTLWRPYLFAAYPRWLAALLIASYLALLIPFLLALPRCRGPACAIPLLAVVGTLLAGLVFVVSMRFRATVEPFLAALGVAFLSRGGAHRDDPKPAEHRPIGSSADAPVSARRARSRPGSGRSPRTGPLPAAPRTGTRRRGG